MSKFYNCTEEDNTETIFNNKPDETASGRLFGDVHITGANHFYIVAFFCNGKVFTFTSLNPFC